MYMIFQEQNTGTSCILNTGTPQILDNVQYNYSLVNQLLLQTFRVLIILLLQKLTLRTTLKLSQIHLLSIFTMEVFIFKSKLCMVSFYTG